MDKGLCPDTSSKRLQVAASAALDDMMTGWLDFYQCPLIVYDFLHFLYFSSICIDSVCVCKLGEVFPAATGAFFFRKNDVN